MENMKNTQKRNMLLKRQNKEFQNPIFFLVSVFDVYLTNCTKKVACKLQKNHPNLALISDTAIKACITPKEKHLA